MLGRIVDNPDTQHSERRLKTVQVHLIEPNPLSHFLAGKSCQQCQTMLILSKPRFVSPIKPGTVHSSSGDTSL